MDGINYTTVQAAVTAACAGAGATVLVPQGTYVGPTTFCSNLSIKTFNYGYFSTPTVLTYAAPLTIANLNNLDIEGFQFNFGANQALTLSSITSSRIDLEVVTSDKTAPALTLTCTNGGGNTAYNQFFRLITTGGSEGIQWKGLGGVSPTCAVSENQFGMLQAFAPASAPASTWTAFDVVQDADSNTVLMSGAWNLQGPLAAMNGWVFNSSSLTTNNDTNSFKVHFFDSTSSTVTGCGVTANQSVGIEITTGILNWSGANQFCLGAGATPIIDWLTLNSNDQRYFMSPTVWGSAQPALYFSSGFNSGIFASLKPASGFTNGTAWTLPNTTGAIGLEPTTYLKNGSGGGNYTAANTTFASVDTAALCQVVTIPAGWKAIVQVAGDLSVSTTLAVVAVSISDVGATCASGGTTPLKESDIEPHATSVFSNFSLTGVINGDGAAHAISLQAKTSNASDAWLIANASSSASPSIVIQLVMSN